jgi:2'-5' RNA ligase
MRRARPAADGLHRVRKDATVAKAEVTTDAVSESGKAPPTQISTRVYPGERVKMPPIDDSADNTELIKLPRKEGEQKCACSDTEKCACGNRVKDAPVAEQKSVDVAKDGAPDRSSASPDGPGVLIALWAPEHIAKKLAQPNGEPADQMHVTLGYYGRQGKHVTEAQVIAMQKCVAKMCQTAMPVKAVVGGIGRFNASEQSDNKDVLIGLVDSPDLHDLRDAIISEVQKCSAIAKCDDQPEVAGARPKRDHGYTPHFTLAYIDPEAQMPVHKLAREEFTFTHLVMAIGEHHHVYKLGESAVRANKCLEAVFKSGDEQRLVTGIVLQPETVDGQGDIYSADVIREAAHKFLSNYNNKTSLGLQHDLMKPKGMELVESWISPVDMVMNNRAIKAGSWMMTVRVLNDELWTRVKTGQISGFSIGGSARVQRLVA